VLHTNSADSNGSPIAADTTVYVFGVPLLTPTDFGLALWDASGNLTADFTRLPLVFRGVTSMAADVLSATMPSGMTTPAAFTWPEGSKSTGTFIGSGPLPWDIRIYKKGWYLGVGDGTIQRVNMQAQYYKDDGSFGFGDNSDPAISHYLTDVDGL
jgi:hypothetical protein